MPLGTFPICGLGREPSRIDNYSVQTDKSIEAGINAFDVAQGVAHLQTPGFDVRSLDDFCLAQGTEATFSWGWNGI